MWKKYRVSWARLFRTVGRLHMYTRLSGTLFTQQISHPNISSLDYYSFGTSFRHMAIVVRGFKARPMKLIVYWAFLL